MKIIVETDNTDVKLTFFFKENMSMTVKADVFWRDKKYYVFGSADRYRGSYVSPEMLKDFADGKNNTLVLDKENSIYFVHENESIILNFSYKSEFSGSFTGEWNKNDFYDMEEKMKLVETALNWTEDENAGYEEYKKSNAFKKGIEYIEEQRGKKIKK